MFCIHHSILKQKVGKMIDAKKLIRLAYKWRKRAAAGRKRPSFPRAERPNSSSVAYKGHFVVYTTDHRRFNIPLAYLNGNIFRELFRISEEEFGLPGEGPIRMPCDSVVMEYIVTVVRKGLSRDLEKVLLGFLASSCGSSAAAAAAFHHGQTAVPQQVLVCGCKDL